jgi:hypothetical protein
MPGCAADGRRGYNTMPLAQQTAHDARDNGREQGEHWSSLLRNTTSMPKARHRRMSRARGVSLIRQTSHSSLCFSFIKNADVLAGTWSMTYSRFSAGDKGIGGHALGRLGNSL